jgi:probable rRNA maturation factor
VDPDSRLRVSVTDGAGRRVRDGGLARWLTSIAPPRARGDLGIALVTDARIHRLNRQYRHKDGPTDVLAFPADADTPAGPPVVGDLVIATGVARRQAREAGHSYQTELRVLALHGLLHLLGYDHHAPTDRGRMARAEARLRRRGGIPAGLIERATNPASGSEPSGRAARSRARARTRVQQRLRPEPSAKARGASERGWGPASTKR